MDNSTSPLSNYRLTVKEGKEALIPRYGLETDSKYFTINSLIRMYGEQEVRQFLQDRGIK